MKKIGFFVLFLQMLLISAFSVQAAGNMTIGAESKNVKAGDEISIAVTVADNPGFAYLKLEYTYDKNVLELMGTQNGTVTGQTNIEQAENAVQWDAAADIMENGTLLTLSFKVKELVAIGSSPVQIKVLGCFNYAEQDVAVSSSVGYVNVEPGIVNVTGISQDKESIKMTADKTVAWSSNEEVATVADGRVSAISAGSATITATTTDGAKTATCVVEVEAKPEVSPMKLSMSSDTATQQEEVLLVVSMENNPGFSDMLLGLALYHEVVDKKVQMSIIL